MQRSGETLRSVAQSVWGDASLWYKLADANGMKGDMALAEGQHLTLPAGVSRTRNNAATLTPYNPNDAIGNVSPSTPQPAARNNHCGIFGAILRLVIAAVVSLFNPFAAIPIIGPVTTDAIAQGIDIAVGLQDKFDFAQLGITAIAATVDFGISQAANALAQTSGALRQVGQFVKAGTPLARAAVGALSNAITQGVAVATGLQSKFDFAGVAAAGVAAGVSRSLSTHFAAGGFSLGERLLTSTASGLANAATRSVIAGTDFGDNIIAALPAAIVNTFSDYVTERITGRAPRGSAAATTNAATDDTPASVLYDGDLLPPPSTQVADLVPRIAASADQDDIVVTGVRHRNWSPAQWSSYSTKQAARENAQQGPSNTLADHYYVDDHRSASTLNELSQWRNAYEALVKKNGPFSDTDKTRAAFAANEQEILRGDALATELVDKPIILAGSAITVTALTAGTGTVAAGYFGLTGWSAFGAGVVTDGVAAGNGGLFYHPLVGERNSFGSYGRDVLVGSGTGGVLRVGGAGVSSLVGRIGASGAASAERAALAQADQIAGGYAADEWGSTSLRAGDRVFGGLPGQSAYYTDAATLETAQGSRAALWERLQVPEHPVRGYRASVGEYEVMQDMRVPSGNALANPAHGVGGGNQFFIDNYSNSLRLVRQIPLGR